MNHLIKRIGNCFIIQTEGDDDYWWWEVNTDGYKGTDEEFINDESNSLKGCSCASFKTVEEAIADYEGEN